MEIVLVIVFVAVVAGILLAKNKKTSGEKNIVRPLSVGSAGQASPSYYEGQEDATDALAAHAEATKNKG